MTLTDAQLGRVVAHALPGARLIEAAPLGARTLRLELAGTRPVVLRLPAPPDPGAGDPLAAEAAALSAMRAAIDLPLPELRTYASADTAEQPYLLTSYLEGMSLPEALPMMNEDQRYNLGRELGALAARTHVYTVSRYGALDLAAPPVLCSHQPSGEVPLTAANDEDLRYLRARLDAALASACAAGELSPADATALVDWASGNLAGTGQPACLIHGDLRPERVLVRRRKRGWILGGLTGWGYALAWRPAWDHVGVMEQFIGSDYFSLRVGYGNAYDATTERHYDQLREFALAPFRLVLFLEAGRPELALAIIQQGRSSLCGAVNI